MEYSHRATLAALTTLTHFILDTPRSAATVTLAATMKRITLRVPDHQHAALVRVLTWERVERGNRYSLNDLCTRLLMVQLSHTPRTGVPAPLGDGTVHILRTPPPPPVPRIPTLPTTNWSFGGTEEPQPERSARPQEGHNEYRLAQESVPRSEIVEGAQGSGSPEVQDGEGSAEAAEIEALEQGAIADMEVEARQRFEDEGGPDGHLAD